METNEKQWNRMKEQMAGYKIIETHAHYNLEKFDGIRTQLLSLMHGAGIEKCVIPAIDYETNSAMKKLFDGPEYDWIYYVFGCHPSYLWQEGEWGEQRWKEYEELLSHRKCVGVGECGIDFHYAQFCPEHEKLQKEFFARFLQMANDHRLPVVLHIRPGEDPLKADETALQVLKAHPVRYGGVCHCFNGSEELAEAYRNCGVEYFGLGGKITFPDEVLEEAVRKLPEESILLETDAPYVKPAGVEGPNTSMSLILIAQKVAQIRETSVDHIIETAGKNSERLFHI